MKKPETSLLGANTQSKGTINNQAQALDEGCTRCQACISHCAFLQKNGMPGDIGASLLAGEAPIDPFACSLCNLCTAVCPADIDPGAFFLELRRQAADQLPLKPYATILGYEQRGSSPLFSWYGLPTGCETVFFPGCSLPGTRPEATWWLYRQLSKQVPHLGVILDCCHKPSHDLGRHPFFVDQFKAINDRLMTAGVRQIIVACPNCYKIFQEYASGISVSTAWELLAESLPDLHLSAITPVQVTLHDPCPLRDNQDIQQAVRSLISGQGLKIREMRHSKKRTVCCGEGGSVGSVHPELASRWGKIRRQEAGDDPVITYCAGCAGFLSRAGIKTIHLADLLANPAKALSGKITASRPPWTYLNRIFLKKRLQRALRPDQD
ncbi:MAG: (Fe-S)-binding protein [Desulfoarculaceae bacterium]|nr:(Fe-S)-binding protein [Desulfoarculaceae bacterium]